MSTSRDDDDLETCSWCVEEVPDSQLRMIADGARLCRLCMQARGQASFLAIINAGSR